MNIRNEPLTYRTLNSDFEGIHHSNTVSLSRLPTHVRKVSITSSNCSSSIGRSRLSQDSATRKFSMIDKKLNWIESALSIKVSQNETNR